MQPHLRRQRSGRIQPLSRLCSSSLESRALCVRDQHYPRAQRRAAHVLQVLAEGLEARNVNAAAATDVRQRRNILGACSGVMNRPLASAREQAATSITRARTHLCRLHHRRKLRLKISLQLHHRRLEL
jgi:hypothetical protein